MAYVTRPTDLIGAVPCKAEAARLPNPAAPVTPPRRQFWMRLIDRVLLAQERDAQRAVEQYVARRGKLTDSIEREIADRLINGRYY